MLCEWSINLIKAVNLDDFDHSESFFTATPISRAKDNHPSYWEPGSSIFPQILKINRPTFDVLVHPPSSFQMVHPQRLLNTRPSKSTKFYDSIYVKPVYTKFSVKHNFLNLNKNTNNYELKLYDRWDMAQILKSQDGQYTWLKWRGGEN